MKILKKSLKRKFFLVFIDHISACILQLVFFKKMFLYVCLYYVYMCVCHMHTVDMEPEEGIGLFELES